MPCIALVNQSCNSGNIRSLINAIEKVGFEVIWVKEPSDLENAEVSLSPTNLKIIANQPTAPNLPRRGQLWTLHDDTP